MAKKKKPKRVCEIVYLDDLRPKEMVNILCLKRNCHSIFAEALSNANNATYHLKCPNCGYSDVVAIRGDLESFEFSPSATNKLER